MLATLTADLLTAWMNPRIRLDANALMVDVIVNPAPPAPMAAPAASERAQARRETLRLLLRRPAFIIGNIIIIGWIICAVLGQRITPYDPFNDFSAGHLPPSPEHWFGTDRIGRDVLSRVMVGSRDVLIVAPLAALLGVTAGTFLGLIMGYYRGRTDDILSRLVEAFLALPGHPRRVADAGRPRHVTAGRRLRRRHPVHADRRADRPLGGPLGDGSSTTSRRPSSAASPGSSSCRARSSPTCSARPWSR